MWLRKADTQESFLQNQSFTLFAWDICFDRGKKRKSKNRIILMFLLFNWIDILLCTSSTLTDCIDTDVSLCSQFESYLFFTSWEYLWRKLIADRNNFQCLMRDKKVWRCVAVSALIYLCIKFNLNLAFVWHAEKIWLMYIVHTIMGFLFIILSLGMIKRYIIALVNSRSVKWPGKNDYLIFDKSTDTSIALYVHLLVVFDLHQLSASVDLIYKINSREGILIVLGLSMLTYTCWFGLTLRGLYKFQISI